MVDIYTCKDLLVFCTQRIQDEFPPPVTIDDNNVHKNNIYTKLFAMHRILSQVEGNANSGKHNFIVGDVKIFIHG